MTNQEKLFNIIKLSCTLLHYNPKCYPFAVELLNCRLLLTLTSSADKLYISYKSYDLLIFSYKKDDGEFSLWNTFDEEIKFNIDVISMDITQYILSYGRLDEFISGTLCGLYSMYDEIIEGIGNELL